MLDNPTIDGLKTLRLLAMAAGLADQQAQPNYAGLSFEERLGLLAGRELAARAIVITGPTGTGKTFLACALAQAAIRNGHPALYQRAPRMLDELAIARGDGRIARLLAAWARTSVLVIDDLLLRPLTPDQAADLLEVIEDRAGLRATIVTSQLPVPRWHQAIADPTIADAVLDRLLGNADRIDLTGESMRKNTGQPAPAAGTAA